MTLKPAPDSHGYIFKRTDLPDQPIINALAENVVETSRGTTLEENGARISTIEHVLASFVGMGIDNVLIEVDGPEAPILDGSAREIVETIEKTGTQDVGLKELEQRPHHQREGRSAAPSGME